MLYMFKKMNLFSKMNMGLLFFLLERPASKLYEREISRKTGVSIGAVNQALKIFVRESILSREKKGRLNLYEVNMKNPLVRELKVLFNILKVKGLVDDIKEESKKVILFGSCSRGNNTEGSDMDIFVLAKDKKAVSASIRKFQEKTSEKLQAVIVEPARLADFKKKNRYFYEQINIGIKLWDENEL